MSVASFSLPLRKPSPARGTPHAYDPALAAHLVWSSDGARILTWNNVVLQSVDRADAAWARSFVSVMRKQHRAYPDGLVSLAVLRTGLKPAPKDVRQELTRMIEEMGRQAHHVFVVEDKGLLAQLLVTVIRGVMMLGGKQAQYSLAADRADAVARALPLVKGAPRSTSLAEELSAAVAFCCDRA